MDVSELLARYEARGDERDFVAAKPLFEQAIAEAEDARLLTRYGYLLETHGRNEVRQAAALYERAIELDPSDDKPHYHLIGACAGLREPERAVALYEQRLAASPESLREYRFLGHAYLTAHDYTRALEIVEAGLAMAPDDAVLISVRGEAKAGRGDAEGALGDWGRALELNPEDIGALYSSAFLLEREDRLEESAAAWQAIIDWNEAREQTLDTEWPKQELERLQAELAALTTGTRPARHGLRDRPGPEAPSRCSPTT
jgi:tetratricopeptide (TPR) repeat protein